MFRRYDLSFEFSSTRFWRCSVKPPEARKKLTAVFATDVVGYSRLMGALRPGCGRGGAP
jgi:hypothetical protein